MTHTPGPWRVAWNWHFKLAVKAGEKRICNAPHMNLGKIERLTRSHRETCFDQTEGFANARLISAAPDMLEALKGLIDWLENNTLHADHTVEADAAKAAIAKAEGRGR